MLICSTKYMLVSINDKDRIMNDLLSIFQNPEMVLFAMTGIFIVVIVVLTIMIERIGHKGH